jgi:protoporphyrin/coproporphyrin ferrochelatase
MAAMGGWRPQAARPLGVLVVQLGTPSAPSRRAVRAYLGEFLSDRRVVDANPLLWQAALRLLILPWRAPRSAAMYRRIWTSAGSPLLVHSQAQAAGLQTRLGEGFRVVLGMRYGQPGLRRAVADLVAAGVERVLVLPMFPQFSVTTTGSVYAAAAAAAFGRRRPVPAGQARLLPALRYVPPYFDDPLYIGALRATVAASLSACDWQPERYLFTFHGLPARHVDEGDPYQDQCAATARCLAAALALDEGTWTVGYQSRFGRGAWLRPDTRQVLEAMARAGVRRLAVVCPGFTADCLETLEEVGNAGARLFARAGGGQLRLVPCLNAAPAWLEAMAAIVRREAGGWVVGPGHPT